MPTYKLHYFEHRGLAEVARQLFVLSGTPFEDIRHSRDQWPELRKTMAFEKFPILEVDGKQIPQSHAIYRYLAKKFGFYGSTAFEAAWVDALADQFKDLNNEMMPFTLVAFGSAEADKERLKKEVALPAVEKHFGHFEKKAKENGSNGRFVGSSITFFDLMITDFLTTAEQILPGLLDPYPAVAAVREKVLNTPKLKEWIASRPKTIA